MLASWRIPSFLFSLVLNRSQFLESSFSATLMGLFIAEPSSSSPAKSSISTLTVNTDDLRPNQSTTHVQENLTFQQESIFFRKQIHDLVTQDPSLAGQFVRLAFHDAATRDNRAENRLGGGGQGPNGSIQYELGRPENRGLAKPLKLIQYQYYGGHETWHYSPFSLLSLADTIALAGAQAIETVGGPVIQIRMGRPDAATADAEFLQTPLQRASSTSSRSLVTKTLPSAGLDSDGLRLYFGRLHQLTEPEWIALTGGSHGLGRHVSLLGMPKECLKNLTRTCLEDAPVLLPFVTESVNRFDNTYFQALLDWNANQVELGQVAFIPTDVDMLVDAGLRRHVQRFAKDTDYFRRVFVRAYQKLVETTTTTKERY
jgi:L-ascorbate peroxidase